jgi:hypothetical protein
MAVTGISHDASGPENPESRGVSDYCNLAAFKPDPSDLLHQPAASVMVMVVAGRADAVIGARRGGWACARAREGSLHSTSTPPSTFLPSTQYLCFQ